MNNLFPLLRHSKQIFMDIVQHPKKEFLCIVLHITFVLLSMPHNGVHEIPRNPVNEWNGNNNRNY